MATPIIWTIISILIIAFTFICNMTSNWFGILIVFFGVANIIVQWLLYYKRK